MSKIEKLIHRFCLKPVDFTWTELIQLLNHYNFTEVSKGRTSGSRRAFINEKTNQIIRIHQPHPANILKQYQIREIREVLGI